MQIQGSGESYSKNNLVSFVYLSICQSYLITETLFSGHEYYTVLAFQEETYFKIKFYFEIIAYSHAVLRDNTEKSHVPFTSFPQ